MRHVGHLLKLILRCTFSKTSKLSAQVSVQNKEIEMGWSPSEFGRDGPRIRIQYFVWKGAREGILEGTCQVLTVFILLRLGPI